MAIIYRHIRLDTNETFYIGIGKSEKRAYATHDRSNLWKKVVNKSNYEVEILKRDLEWEDACDLEKALISWYGRKNLGLGPLVNLTDGGDGTLNHVVSDETRKKRSLSLKGRKRTEETKNKMRGKKSEEHRKNISESRKGKPSNTKGKKQSDEHIEKRATAKRGKKLSEEHRKKLSDAHKGIKPSDETRKKLSDAHKGKKKGPMSDAHKKKLSDSHKGLIPWNIGKSKYTIEDYYKIIELKEKGMSYKDISLFLFDDGNKYRYVIKKYKDE